VNRFQRTFAALLLGAALGGCGAEPGGTSSTGVEDPPGLPGVYAMDVERTTGGMTKDADGNAVRLSPEALKQVQANNRPEQCRLELHPDGTFELITGMGEEDFRTGGSWKETPGGVELTTKTINGEAAPPEATVPETYTREDGFLVIDAAGMRVYLKRQP